MNQHPDDVWTHEPASLDVPELCVVARSMIAARRALHGPLPSAMIHDPALDLLLAAFMAHVAGGALEEHELIGRTTVGEAQAKRWVRALEQAGLFDRDGATIGLSGTGVVQMTETLRAVARSQWHLDGE